MAKPKDLDWEAQLLLRRLEFVKNLRESLQIKDSLASVTVEAYTSVVDGALDRKPSALHALAAPRPVTESRCRTQSLSRRRPCPCTERSRREW